MVIKPVILYLTNNEHKLSNQNDLFKTYFSIKFIKIFNPFSENISKNEVFILLIDDDYFNDFDIQVFYKETINRFQFAITFLMVKKIKSINNSLFQYKNFYGFLSEPISEDDIDNIKGKITGIGRVKEKYAILFKENSKLINHNDKLQHELKSAFATEKKLKDNVARFRGIIAGMNDVVFRVSMPDGKYEYISPAVLQVFGYNENDFYDNSFFVEKIIHPDYKDYFKSKLGDLSKGHVASNLEFKIITNDGAEKWVIQSVKPIYEKENLVAIEGISRDITDWKLTEIALKESELKYKTLLNHIPQKVYYKDIALKYLAVNPSFAKDFNCAPDDFAGKTDFDIFPIELAEKRKTDEERIIQSGKMEEIEEVFMEKGIKKVNQSVKCPVRDKDHNVIGILGIFWDITEKKKVEEKLKRALKEVMIANEEIIVSNVQLEQQKAEVARHNEEIKKQHEILQYQQQQLTDSIIYAQRIQSVALPLDNNFKTLFPENFILYLPRDIVSGDFYWFKRIKNHIIIAAADCTGHGVPGAFMSMLGIALINEVVTSLDVLKTDQILNLLRKRIKDSLHQELYERVTGDGMDIAICVIDTHNNLMQYSGANNPLYLIRRENNQPNFIELRPDHMPIAKSYDEKPFNLQEIQLIPNDYIYLFSDGFKDQFGGPLGKRYTSRRLKHFILEIADISLHSQKDIFYNEFISWKGYTEQIDDILVMGFKIPKRYTF